MRNYIFYTFFIMIFLAGCVEPFEPDVDGYDDLIVIQGKITNEEGYHKVFVSRTYQYDDPTITKVRNCEVYVTDNKNNIFSFEETSPGVYQCWIAKEDLEVGTQFQLNVITEDNVRYQSEVETILPCPAVSKLYYEERSFESDDNLTTLNGVQFYVDVDASGLETRSFMWDMTEAWEYHSNWGIFAFYTDFTITELEEPIGCYDICYTSQKTNEYFISSSSSLSSGRLVKVPLNFVSNETPRLRHKYGILLNQYSISEGAYNYFDKLKKQEEGTGGLYESQPGLIIGNITNINDPGETVLGFFMASAVQHEVVFTNTHFTFTTYENQECVPLEYSTEELYRYLRRQSQYDTTYLIVTSSGNFDLVDQGCIDCRQRGGTLEPPSFWE